MDQHPEPASRPEIEADRVLVQDALARRPEAARRFVEKMRCVARMLAARNYKLGSPLADAELEDLAQETMIEIWGRLPEYDGRTPLEGWCWGFCRLTLLRKLRATRRREDMLIRAEDVLRARVAGTEPVELEDYDKLHKGLADLDRDESTVVELKHFHDLTFEGIGQQLSIPANTAKTRYYRALSKLRAFLGRSPSRSRGTSA